MTTEIDYREIRSVDDERFFEAQELSFADSLYVVRKIASLEVSIDQEGIWIGEDARLVWESVPESRSCKIMYEMEDLLKKIKDISDFADFVLQEFEKEYRAQISH